MSNELTASSHGFQRVEDEFDRTTIEGHYFKALDDIEARKETSARAARSWDTQVDENGKVPVTYQARRAISKDTVLLALKVHFLDNRFHAVEFAAHPSDPDQSSLLFMSDEFSNFFAEELEWEQIRAAEIAKVQENIRDKQANLITGMKMPDFLQAHEQPQEQTNTADGISQALAIASQQQERAKAMIAAAEQMKSAIVLAEKEISKSTTELSRYFTERGKASIAGRRSLIGRRPKAEPRRSNHVLVRPVRRICKKRLSKVSQPQMQSLFVSSKENFFLTKNSQSTLRLAGLTSPTWEPSAYFWIRPGLYRSDCTNTTWYHARRFEAQRIPI